MDFVISSYSSRDVDCVHRGRAQRDSGNTLSRRGIPWVAEKISAEHLWIFFPASSVVGPEYSELPVTQSHILQPSVMQGIADEIRSLLETELGHDVGPMSLDCFHTKTELSGNFLIRVT